MEDMLKWEETTNDTLVNSTYLALRSRPVESFPWLGVWKTGVQPKISLFTWEAIWGKILTCDQLQKRGFTLANRFYLCLEEEETADHLLLSLCEDKTFMGVAPLSLWSLVDEPKFSLGDFGELELLCGSQKKKIRVESRSFMLILDDLEGKESGCF